MFFYFSQILAVDGISLLTLNYDDALRLLQTSGRVVELVISQLAPHISNNRPASSLNASKHSKSVERFQNLELQTVIDQDELVDPMEKYFSTMKQRHEPNNQNQVKNTLNQYKNTSFSLNHSKSVPDLPKVVGIIPKRIERAALPRSLGLSRKYIGPVRYPVTPAKDPMKIEAVVGRRQLSLPVDIDDGQVFI